METGKLVPLVELFEGIADWRSPRQTRHQLSEVLTVAVCAVLSGADDFEGISQWGGAKLNWLRGFMTLEFGVASPDTFERVFAVLDPQHFEAAFRSWVSGTIPALEAGQIVAIDGKSSRRSTSKAAAQPLHLVSAFAADIGVVLGQRATDEKSNEITAIPALLDTLALEGCIVTIDAMGTQTAIAQTIIKREADYVLCIKDNQRNLADSILDTQTGVGGAALVEDTYVESHHTGHGRQEIRRCWAYSAIERLHQPEKWAGIQSFAVVERVRTLGEKTTTERHYYISSLPADAQKIAHAIRSHWEIENRLHWCLDVQFGDDHARAREGHAANNLAVVRHIALNLIRLDTSRKASIKTKRLLASGSDKFRSTLLGL
jgi:predicted transposase YbfD/YdcC